MKVAFKLGKIVTEVGVTIEGLEFSGECTMEELKDFYALQKQAMEEGPALLEIMYEKFKQVESKINETKIDEEGIDLENGATFKRNLLNL